MRHNAATQLSAFELNAFDRKVACRPFLKWAGGKSQIVPELLARFPEKIDRYYEPFLGGGAVLFAFRPHAATVLDVNPELINVFKVVRDNVKTLIRSLRRRVYSEEQYYKLRDADRKPGFAKWSAVRRAARLLYLNKTCYNGLYRVNSQGLFNTPFGKYKNPIICDAPTLRACSRLLQNIDIREGDFRQIEHEVTTGDFIYFDPPYVPLTTTANFTSYTKSGFDLEMQKDLYQLCCRLDRRGIRFMVSNSASQFVQELYKRFRIEPVYANRALNSKATARGKVQDCLIRNY